MTQSLDRSRLPDEDDVLPSWLQEAFEDTIATYRDDLAPGAETRLRKRTLLKYQNGEIRLGADVCADLIGFLEGQDLADAKEARQAEPGTGGLIGHEHYTDARDDRPDRADMKALDPRSYLPGRKAEAAAPITVVLRQIGNLTPEGQKVLEAELADKCFDMGGDLRQVAKTVHGYVRRRANWKHMDRQPPLSESETMVRKALAPHKHRFKDNAYETTAMEWGVSIGRDAWEPWQVNREVSRRLADPLIAAARLRDGEPIETDPNDPALQDPAEIKRLEESHNDGLLSSSQYYNSGDYSHRSGPVKQYPLAESYERMRQAMLKQQW